MDNKVNLVFKEVSVDLASIPEVVVELLSVDLLHAKIDSDH
jgi:hypothetical protein